MVYQYIFGRDTEIGYKTINASTKLKADGEYVWQSKLNIDYTPPDNDDDYYPEPLVYYNIKEQTSVVGKIVYQTSHARNNYMQHYYLIEGEERDNFLKNSYQFDIDNFANTVEEAYNLDVENQDIYNHIYFSAEEAKKVILYQSISKKVLELVIFACFEAATTDAKVYFINDFSAKDTTDNNLNLLKIIFSVIPECFKTKLGFITYYKYLVSPAGKSLRSDIKLIFTENSEQNVNSRNTLIREGNYLFDFVNNKTAVNTENILYAGLLEFLTEPFFIDKSIENALDVLDKILSYFNNPMKVRYNMAAIVYELFYRHRHMDYRIANILFDNYSLLGQELKDLLYSWVLSDEMKSMGDERDMYSLLIKAFSYDEYKDKIVEYFAKQICTKNEKYVDVLFDNEIMPFRLMESVCIKLLNEDEYLEGGIFILQSSLLNCKDKTSNVFHPIEVFDVIKYFSQFSNQYYKYFDELEIYNDYFKNSLNRLDITGFESLSNSFSKLIATVNHEATAARLRVLHRLILKKYVLPRFESLDEVEDLNVAIDICFRLLICVKPEEEYFHEDIANCFKTFSLTLVSTRNISNFENIDYYFQKAIENYKTVSTFLKVISEILLKAFSKEDLKTDEYNRLLNYAKELGIKLDTNKISNFDVYEFNSKLTKYISDNDISGIVKLLETKGSLLKPNTKNNLIKWVKNSYKGEKDGEFFRFLIYLYANDYSGIFEFIEEDDDDYASLRLYMREMKNLGLSSNKEYMKFIYTYINENRKLKKYIKSLNTNQKREIGLNNFDDMVKGSDFNNPIVLFTIIYLLFGITVFLIIRTVNSTFKIESLIITLIVNIVVIAAMYGIWFYEISDYDRAKVISRIYTAISIIALVINIAVGAADLIKPKNVLANKFKDLYAVKYDNMPPVVEINSVFIDDGEDVTLVVDDIKNGITINESDTAIIVLNTQDDSDYSVRAKIGDIDKSVDSKKIIRIAGDELTSIDSTLKITADDTYKNTAKEIEIPLTKQIGGNENKINATFSASVYNSEKAATDYPSIANDFKFNVSEGGYVEFKFNVETSSKYKYIITPMLNDTVIPLQSIVFSDKGCTGSFSVSYDYLNDTNTLNVKVNDAKNAQEYKFTIDKIQE